MTGPRLLISKVVGAPPKVPLLMGLIVLSACAAVPPIQPASSSRSQFEGAVYKGETDTIGSGTPGVEKFRVFSKGGTGFVSLASVREDAEQRSTAFCERKGKVYNPLSETRSTPPYILGNFPRIEIIFECGDKPTPVGVSAAEDPRYRKLTDLKKLLDNGTLTQREFDSEKAKVLDQAQP